MRLPSRQSLLRVTACALGSCVGVSSTIQGGVLTFLGELIRAHANSTLAAATNTPPDTRCGTETSSVLMASLISFSVGVLLLLIVNAGRETRRWRRGEPLGMQSPDRWWQVTGGLLGCSVMVLSLLALRLTGFALAAVLRAAGTTAASLALDRVGCLGTPVRRLTLQRGLGMLLLIAGSAISVAQELGEALSHTQQIGGYLLAAALPLLAGALLPMQAAINGRLAKRLGWPLRATFISFLGGLCCLEIAVTACGVPADALTALLGAPWWAFTGGVLGMMMVSANFLLPVYVGFAALSGFVTFGTLASSLVLDALGAFGLQPRPPTALRIGGALLALSGAVVTRQHGAARDGKSLLHALELRSEQAVSASAAANGAPARAVVDDPEPDGTEVGEDVRTTGTR